MENNVLVFNDSGSFAQKQSDEITIIRKLDTPAPFFAGDIYFPSKINPVLSVISETKKLLKLDKKKINFDLLIGFLGDKDANLAYLVIFAECRNEEVEAARNYINAQVAHAKQNLSFLEMITDPNSRVNIQNSGDYKLVGPNSIKSTPYLENGVPHFSGVDELEELKKLFKDFKSKDGMNFDGVSYDLHKSDQNQPFSSALTEEGDFSGLYNGRLKSKREYYFVKDTQSVKENVVVTFLSSKIESEFISHLKETEELDLIESPWFFLSGFITYEYQLKSGYKKVKSIEVKEFKVSK